MSRPTLDNKKISLDDLNRSIEETNRAIKAILMAIRELEQQQELQLMPEGEYLGEKFE